MTTTNNNFICPNCNHNRGWMVMSSNDKPATQCDKCGHLVIQLSPQAFKEDYVYETVPPITRHHARLIDYMKRCDKETQRQFYLQFSTSRYNLPPGLIPYKFSPGEIVTCVEGFNKEVFSGYNYMVIDHDLDCGLVTLKNLRTMKALPGAYSATRFKCATLVSIENLKTVAVARKWKWVEEALKPALPAPVWVKPKAKVLTMADKLYWRNYNRAFKSKNTGQPLPTPAPKLERKFKFHGTNPFNIKPWGK